MPPSIDDFNRLEGKVDTLVECLQGDLKNGKPGLVGRIDRLEVSEKRREKWTWAAIGAGMAAMGTTVWSVLSGGKHP